MEHKASKAGKWIIASHALRAAAIHLGIFRLCELPQTAAKGINIGNKVDGSGFSIQHILDVRIESLDSSLRCATFRMTDGAPAPNHSYEGRSLNNPWLGSALRHSRENGNPGGAGYGLPPSREW